MKNKVYLTAKEAAESLGISLTTLYAYVSRGLIRSEDLDQRKRTRHYHAEDVEKLKQRREHRKNPKKAIQRTMHFGSPILESKLTLITDNQLYYRGYKAIQLAETYGLEQVAHLLWTGALVGDPVVFDDVALMEDLWLESCQKLQHLRPIERMQALLPLVAASDLTAYDLNPEGVQHTAPKILRLLYSFATGKTCGTHSLAKSLQEAWLPEDASAAKILERALIVCADHELNVSSFTARCVASAMATPYQVVIAGLAALQGAKHGRESERFEALMHEVGKPERARRAIAGRLSRQEHIPGFGHTLYPAGDPRGAYLLQLVAAERPHGPDLDLVNSICSVVEEATGLKPTLDVGLAAVSAGLGLPEGGAISLFALGRVIGWLGHAIEAYQTDQLIRPRASYTGEKPRDI